VATSAAVHSHTIIKITIKIIASLLMRLFQINIKMNTEDIETLLSIDV
jgi:hypothetical protein